MRAIACTDCGKIKPTHPDDAALGLFCRYSTGRLRVSLTCDYCGKDIPEGDVAVAISQPDTMRRWETDYMLEMDALRSISEPARIPHNED